MFYIDSKKTREAFSTFCRINKESNYTWCLTGYLQFAEKTKSNSIGSVTVYFLEKKNEVVCGNTEDGLYSWGENLERDLENEEGSLKKDRLCFFLEIIVEESVPRGIIEKKINISKLN